MNSNHDSKGRFSSGGGGLQFGVKVEKMRSNPIPKSLKKAFAKAGGVNSQAYQMWVKKNWS